MKGVFFRRASLAMLAALGVVTPVFANPPRIYHFGPTVRYVAEHQAYSFAVGAVGGHSLEYHWWHQEPDAAAGHQIPQEPGLVIGRPRLTVQNALPNRDYNGWYWCVVVDRVTGESSTSPRGQLIVYTAPTITSQPTDQTAPVGGTASFTVAADAGAPVPISYHWYFNNKPMFGAIHPTLTLSHLRTTRGGYYSCRVRTAAGTTWSGGALLTVTQ